MCFYIEYCSKSIHKPVYQVSCLYIKSSAGKFLAIGGVVASSGFLPTVIIRFPFSLVLNNGCADSQIVIAPSGK